MIANGHRRQDIDGYTLGQVRLYFEAAIRMNRRDMASQSRAVMLGIAGAFGEDVNDTLEKLEG
ncbi:MAG: hypothetical protein KGL39_11015 [Patescibacteria group bacterium]|nr:hypothetical protein [Patescibacteria group bacterium]